MPGGALLSLTAERRFSELRQEGRTVSGTLIRYGDTASLPFGLNASRRELSATCRSLMFCSMWHTFGNDLWRERAAAGLSWLTPTQR